MIETTNHGPIILASTYWGGEWDRKGLLYLSVNAGAFRLLLPSGWEQAVDEMRTGKDVIISLGPWARDPGRGERSYELLFDDGSESPYAVHLPVAQSDRVPPPEDAGKEWVFSAWTAPRRDKPHLALQRPCWLRLVTAIPCLLPREG